MRKIILLLLILISNSLLASDLYCRQTSRMFPNVYTESMLDYLFGFRANHFYKYDEGRREYKRTDVNIPFRNKTMTCQDVANVSHVIGGISNWMKGHLAIPGPMALAILPTDNNAFFSPGILNLPMQYVENNTAKHPMYTRPIWAHEYGHAIFALNMGRLFPKLEKLRRTHETLAQCQLKSLSMQRDLSELEKKIEDAENSNSYTDEQLQQMGARMAMLGDALYKAEEQCFVAMENQQTHEGEFEQLNFITQMTLSYNELFADLIAVLHFRDGQAVSRALTLRNQRDYTVTNRDFTERKNALNKWVEPYDMGPHEQLAPSRYHIWRQYITLPEYKNHPGFIAKVVFQAIVNVTAKFYQAYEAMLGEHDDEAYDRFDMIQEMSSNEMNRQLMKAIDREFNKYKRTQR